MIERGPHMGGKQGEQEVGTGPVWAAWRIKSMKRLGFRWSYLQPASSETYGWHLSPAALAVAWLIARLGGWDGRGQSPLDVVGVHPY